MAALKMVMRAESLGCQLKGLGKFLLGCGLRILLRPREGSLRRGTNSRLCIVLISLPRTQQSQKNVCFKIEINRIEKME